MDIQDAMSRWQIPPYMTDPRRHKDLCFLRMSDEERDIMRGIAERLSLGWGVYSKISEEKP